VSWTLGIFISSEGKLGVTLEDNTWKILFLTPNKKQYFGITAQDELIHTTLTGMKSNQPAYFGKVSRKLMDKEFQESFLIADNPLDAVLTYVRSAFAQLEDERVDELSFSKEAKKALYEYKNNGIERRIYNEIVEDCGSVELAQSRSQGKCVYRYWKVKAKDRSATIHPEKYQLNMAEYRKELFNCIKPVLLAYGMKEGEEIDRLDDELVGHQKRIISRRNY
jgi:hypothetical protein